MQRGQTAQDGVLPTLSDITDIENLQVNTRVETLDGLRYKVTGSDEGGGILLTNGLYLNEVYDRPSQEVPNNQTGTTYTVVLTDADKTIWMNNASPNVLSIPLNATVAYPTNTVIMVMMEGVGETSVTAVAGVTLNGVDGGSAVINAQYSGATLVKRGIDTWVMSGNTAEVA